MGMEAEKKRQEEYPWSRTTYHTTYNMILAKYKVQSCLEHATGNSLMDLACGDGLMTKAFCERFDRVVGIDASGTHLEKARDLCPDAEFHESLIEEFETDEKFDSVFMLDILEHVIDPQALLQKAASFMSDDGVMVVHVPNCDAVNRKIAVLMGTLTSCDELTPFDIDIAGHRRSYNIKSLRKDVEGAGLTVKETGGIFYKMMSTAQIDWFLQNGLWEGNNFGWGRVGGEQKDWREEFCRACYEYGKENPEDCNIIYAVITKK